MAGDTDILTGLWHFHFTAFSISIFSFLYIINEAKRARGQGFEPQFSGSEPEVLPLDDPRMVRFHSPRVFYTFKYFLTERDAEIVPRPIPIAN